VQGKPVNVTIGAKEYRGARLTIIDKRTVQMEHNGQTSTVVLSAITMIQESPEWNGTVTVF
jgi:hypothetical protein